MYSEVDLVKYPRLIQNPLEQESIQEMTLWSRWEIQLFLEQYFIHPKNFVKMSGHFAHKDIGQLVQFYFNFKWVFELKTYSFSYYRNYWRLIGVKKDKRVSFHDLAKELSKRLITEKLGLTGDQKDKVLFTIAEIKEMAQEQVGKLTEEQKAKLKKWNFDYAKRIRNDKMKKYNTNFFYEYYNEENSKILSLFKSTLLEIPKPIEESIIDKKSDEKVFVKESKVKNIESIKVTIKGTNWSIEEKEVFFKCIKELGKNWKLLHEHFPNKTDKQLRNFYQNNKKKIEDIEKDSGANS